MLRPIVFVSACICSAALSGTAWAQDVRTDSAACHRFCGNKLGADIPNAVIKCNPETAIDLAKCVCENKEIIPAVEACVKQACPVFQGDLKAECDRVRALSGGTGAKTHSRTSLVVGASAMIAGALLV